MKKLRKILGSVSIVATSLLCATQLTVGVASAQPLPPPETQQEAPAGTHCGENLILLVRGSGELPQGLQPDTLTYQQRGNDLFGAPFAQDSTGGGRLGKGALQYVPEGYRVAALTYPAFPIKYKGGVTPTLDNFHLSASEGAHQLSRALEQIYAPCGQEPPHLILMGYSQGADVINIAISEGDRNIDRVEKIMLLADPSRRAYGPENDNAFVHMAPTNPIGGISRAVTDAVDYRLVLPTLDKYRDSHPKKISSYCVPGDLVCDTRSVEAWRGVTLHVVYDNLLARCDAADGQYAQILDCLYADALGRKAQPASVAFGPGWLNLTFSRGLRDETVGQDVTAQFGARTFASSIRAGGSGSASILMGLNVPGVNDLKISLDGKEVADLPAHFEPWRTSAYTAIFVQAPDEHPEKLPPPLKEQLTTWELPLQQRIELIRTVFGPFAAKTITQWFAMVYHYGWDQAHEKELEAVFGNDVSVKPIAPPMFSFDLFALLNVFAAVF